MKVAIIGRPNVGKSTLFNRFVGRKIAIVDDIAGVTRDWRSLPAQLGDMKFDIIDTAGLMGFEEDMLFKQIEAQTAEVLQSVDLILFVVDGREGLVANDENLVRHLRRKVQTPIQLLANKCENSKNANNLGDFYRLGVGEPIAIAAEHGIGMDDVYDVLKARAIEIGEDPSATVVQDEDAPFDPDAAGEDFTQRTLNVAIIGRPNAGKSTLINSFLGKERLLTGDMPGVTRDAIHLDWQYEGRNIQLVDTAGMRKKARIDRRLERLSVGDSLKAIRYAEITVLVVDAQMPLEKQDLTIAEHVINEGRALVIAVNKSDLMKGDFITELRRELLYVLPQAKGIPCISISAKNKKNLDKLMAAVFEQEKLWNTRIGTAVLNQWLAETTSHHPPPLAGGKRIRLKYMTQIKTRPPTFVIFISKPAELLDSYLRYLLNKMRDDFDLPGIPIRFQVRKGKNPFDQK